MLSVERYYALERAARIQAPMSAMRAFLPLAFLQDGYPVHIDHEQEIAKLADHARPVSDEHYTKTVCRPHEIALIGRIREAVARITERTIGRTIRPYFNFGGVTQPYRLVTRLSDALWLGPKETGPAIWEIGCGTGFLGAMLVADGFTYRGLDVTPLMYLWQNRLWTELVGPDAIDEQADLSLDQAASYPAAKQVIHIPWWRYIRDFSTNVPKIDIVICDHALCELTDLAFRHVLKTAARALTGSQIGALVCTSFGAVSQRDGPALIQGLYDAGFAMAWHSNCWVALHRSSPYFKQTYGHQDVLACLRDRVMYVDEQRSGEVMRAAANLYPKDTETGLQTIAQAFPLGEDVADEILFGAYAGQFNWSEDLLRQWAGREMPYGRAPWKNESEFG